VCINFVNQNLHSSEQHNSPLCVLQALISAARVSNAFANDSNCCNCRRVFDMDALKYHSCQRSDIQCLLYLAVRFRRGNIDTQ
jgi:hypothetical protein